MVERCSCELKGMVATYRRIEIDNAATLTMDQTRDTTWASAGENYTRGDRWKLGEETIDAIRQIDRFVVVLGAMGGD